MTARERTAAEWRTEARRLEAEAHRADDEQRHDDAGRLYARARLAWHAVVPASLAAIGGAS